MPKKKTEVAEETAVSSKAVQVTWNGNVRVYSEADHGKDFAKLAKQFAEKVGGEVG